jgi:hypothetical protein
MKKILILVFVLAPQAGFTAFSNYNSVLIGDQVAGMGGAGTAAVGDVAASPYYNPATLGMLEASAFSAAVGVYKKFDTFYGEAVDFTKQPMRVSQGYFRSLPSSVGSAIRYKDYVLALSIVVPDYDTFKGDLYNVLDDVTTLTFTDESLWTGVGFGKKISDTESVGATVYYTARNLTYSLSDRSFSGGTSKIFTSEKTKQDNTLVAVLGYYRTINDKWSMGLILRPRSVKVASKVTVFQSTTEGFTGPAPTQSTVNESEVGGDFIIPTKLALGWTYKRDPTWIFSGDISWHEAVSYDEAVVPEISNEISHRHTYNINFGAQKEVYSWFKIRGGVFTDISAHRSPTSEDRLQQDHVDMWGFSANFDFIAGNKIGYTFGGYYNGGKGLSRQRINHSFQTVDKSQNIFTMLLGTSFYF